MGNTKAPLYSSQLHPTVTPSISSHWEQGHKAPTTFQNNIWPVPQNFKPTRSKIFQDKQSCLWTEKVTCGVPGSYWILVNFPLTFIILWPLPFGRAFFPDKITLGDLATTKLTKHSDNGEASGQHYQDHVP